jgi:hypothetical protein
MCRSLRSAPGCPLCRDENSGPRLFEFTIDTNGNIVDGTAELVTEIQNQMGQEDIQRSIEISTKLEEISKLRKIQMLRQKLNIAKKEYRRNEEILKKKRADMLNQSFEDFRLEHKQKYELTRKKFNKQLRQLKYAEAIEIQKLMPEIDVGPHNIDKYVSYKLTDILSDTFGPQKRNFWRI